MALPITFVAADVDFTSRFAQGRTKSHISSAGSVYAFFRGSAGDEGDELKVQKTTDPDTIDFTELTFLQIPDSNSISGMATYQEDGSDIVHIATTSGTTVHYHRFNMATDAFITSNEATGALTIDEFSTKVCSIAVETDGSVIIEYQADTENNMGQKQRVDYAFKPIGGSWTNDVGLDDGGAINYHCGALIRGASNKFHLCFHDTTNLDAIHKSVQDVDGTLSSGETYNSVSTDQVNLYQIATPVFYDDDGVERVTLGHQTLSEIVRTAVVDNDGTPEASIEASLVGSTAEAVGVDGLKGAYSLAVDADDKSVWIIFGRASDDDVYRAQNKDNETPWQDGVEELDAVDVNIITSNIYERDSNIVLAYIYEDGTAVKYNEFIIRAVGAVEKVAFDDVDLEVNEVQTLLLSIADRVDLADLEVNEVLTDLLSRADRLDDIDLEVDEVLTDLENQVTAQDILDLAVVESPGQVAIMVDALDTLDLTIEEGVTLLLAIISPQDLLDLAIDEVQTQVEVEATAQDTLDLEVNEVLTELLSRIEVTDTVDLEVLEVLAQVVVGITAEDDVDLAIEEGPTQVVVGIVSDDTLDLAIIEGVTDLLALIDRSDTVGLTIVEGVPLLFVQASATDLLDLEINEDVGQISVGILATDVLDLEVVEAVGQVMVIIQASDLLDLSISEVAQVVGFLNRTDILDLDLTEQADLLAFIQATDDLDIDLLDVAQLVSIIQAADDLDIDIGEVAQSLNVLSVLDTLDIDLTEDPGDVLAIAAFEGIIVQPFTLQVTRVARFTLQVNPPVKFTLQSTRVARFILQIEGSGEQKP